MQWKLILAVFLLALNSCATVNVDVDYDESVDFFHLSRYAWLEDVPPKTGNTIVDSNTLMHDRIHLGIDQWFERHGYLKSKRSEADFLVIYRMVVENKTRVSVLNPYYDYPFSWHYGYNRGYYSSFAWNYYPDLQTYEYQRDTLVIDFVDPKTKKLIWRGMAYQDISPNIRPERKQRYIDKAIQSILSKFPPPGNPS